MYDLSILYLLINIIIISSRVRSAELYLFPQGNIIIFYFPQLEIYNLRKYLQ